MNQEIDYHSKYLKYKKKYLNLKSELDGGDNELSWKNEPKFVPKFDDNTVKANDMKCDKFELKMYNFVTKKEDEEDEEEEDEYDENFVRISKVAKYKWCDDEAKVILSLKSGIRNAAEVVNRLFTEFIAKIYNFKSDGRTLTLFSIDFEANNAKCHIKLEVRYHGYKKKTFSESLGWYYSKIHYNNHPTLGMRDKDYINNFYVDWRFFNEKTNVKELFDEKKHFKDGFFGKVKKATIDGKEIDIDKFKSNSKDFAFGVEYNMNHILQEFAGMIYQPNSKNCTEFLKNFHSFWNSSHLFYESIKK